MQLKDTLRYLNSFSLFIRLGRYCSYTNYLALPLSANYIKSKYFIDTIQLVDKYYYDVFVDSSLLQYDDCSTINYAERMFYSTQYGFLKMDFLDGNTWELASVSFGGE